MRTEIEGHTPVKISKIANGYTVSNPWKGEIYFATLAEALASIKEPTNE